MPAVSRVERVRGVPTRRELAIRSKVARFCGKIPPIRLSCGIRKDFADTTDFCDS